jgi:triphosphatase
VPNEVELKLALPAAALRKAERLPWLRRLTQEPVAHDELTSVYFDTKGRKLRRHGVTLRVRRHGAKYIQTIKGESGAAPALGRFEREDEVTSTQPRLKYAKDTPLEPLVTPKLKRKLRPVFRTQVQRASMQVRLNGSEIALAFDHGKVLAGTRAQPLHELELELKHGHAQDVARLARRLRKDLPIAFGARAKSDRGYALVEGAVDGAVRAAPIVLDPQQSAGSAFAQIGLACLQHVAANQNAVAAGDGEGVHQMRVGLRRLRAAISLFDAMPQGRELAAIKRDLKWLAGELGPARDLDVLTHEAIAPLRRENPEQREIVLLEQDVRRARRVEFDRAAKAVAGPRYRDVVLQTALWLIDGDWCHAGGAGAKLRAAAIAPVAADILKRRARKVIKKSKRLKELDAAQRHRLRIAVKKLRYGCDFFETLFDRAAAQRKYGKALKQLQGCLGRLNDLRVHAEKAHQLANPKRHAPRGAPKAYAMGFLTGREQRLAPALISAAERAGRKLKAAREFW